MKLINKDRLDLINQKTIQIMISMYCRARHNSAEKLNNGLCYDCSELESYALKKLANCPFGSEKPNCPNCPVHCYSKEMRERISVIMRYSGPRMVLKHPILTGYHIFNSLRKVTLPGKPL